MRTNPVTMWTAATAIGAALLSGCSSGTDSGGAQPSQSQSPASSSAPATTETHVAEPGRVGVSPGGVTTAVGAPAASTETEYFQACSAAKTWMTQQGGDLKGQFEPYLKDLQTTDSAGPGTFNTPWSALPPERQAAVIVAAEAAADDLCG